MLNPAYPSLYFVSSQTVNELESLTKGTLV